MFFVFCQNFLHTFTYWLQPYIPPDLDAATFAAVQLGPCVSGGDFTSNSSFLLGMKPLPKFVCLCRSYHPGRLVLSPTPLKNINYVCTSPARLCCFFASHMLCFGVAQQLKESICPQYKTSTREIGPIVPNQYNCKDLLTSITNNVIL